MQQSLSWGDKESLSQENMEPEVSLFSSKDPPLSHIRSEIDLVDNFT
jgi:hypothetical protein